MKRILFGALAIASLAWSSASAQKHSPRKATSNRGLAGLTLGAYTVVAAGATLDGPDIHGGIRTAMGEGLGVQVGYRFSPRAMLFASIDGAKQAVTADYLEGNTGLMHFELGGRLLFPSANPRLTPFATAFIGKRALKSSSGHFEGDNFALKLSGAEIGVGGGVLYAFSPVLALDAGLLVSRGKFGHASYHGDINDELALAIRGTTTMRLKVGFQWSPARRRL